MLSQVEVLEALHSWCIVETILSIIIFVHAMKEVVEMLKSPSDGDLLPYDVLACTGCAVGCAAWTEVSHSFCPSTSEGAVDSIASINEGGVSRLGSDGVDLFEYHDVITTGLKIWKVVSVWSIYQVLFFRALSIALLLLWDRVPPDLSWGTFG